MSVLRYHRIWENNPTYVELYSLQAVKLSFKTVNSWGQPMESLCLFIIFHDAEFNCDWEISGLTEYK